MEKECGQIKFTETDDGFRIDVIGKSLKDMCSCGCCMPMFCVPQASKSDCCPPTDQKK